MEVSERSEACYDMCCVSVGWFGFLCQLLCRHTEHSESNRVAG
jgi:hypothetical protein